MKKLIQGLVLGTVLAFGGQAAAQGWGEVAQAPGVWSSLQEVEKEDQQENQNTTVPCYIPVEGGKGSCGCTPMQVCTKTPFCEYYRGACLVFTTVCTATEWVFDPTGKRILACVATGLVCQVYETLSRCGEKNECITYCRYD